MTSSSITAAATLYCPTCDAETRALRDKPWLPAVCLECGATLREAPRRNVEETP